MVLVLVLVLYSLSYSCLATDSIVLTFVLLSCSPIVCIFMFNSGTSVSKILKFSLNRTADHFRPLKKYLTSQTTFKKFISSKDIVDQVSFVKRANSRREKCDTQKWLCTKLVRRSLAHKDDELKEYTSSVTQQSRLFVRENPRCPVYTMRKHSTLCPIILDCRLEFKKTNGEERR